MAVTLNTTTCIYCPSTGPFTKEHIFPAGLGGDDAFQLEDLVCGHCNTKVFGPLDQALMRRSPAALARIFLMTQGRRDGGAPQLDSNVVEMADPISHLVEEMEIVAGGKFRVRPQMLFNGIMCPVQATDADDMQAFVAKLASTLTDAVHVIVKEKTESSTSFHITTFAWDGSKYGQTETTTEKQLPAIGVWRETLTPSKTAKPDWIYVSRLFLRAEGQLVVRVLPQDDLSAILNNARMVLDLLQKQPTFTSQSTEKPDVHIGMTMDMNLVHRAMAKTGVNHVCQEYGQAIVRLAAFDLVKQAINTGSPQINAQGWVDPKMERIFTQDQRPVHLAMLWPVAQPDGTFNILFGIRLFGTPFQGIILAEGVALPLGAAPVIYTVHYEERRTERQTLAEYLIAAVVPKLLDEGRTRAGLS